MRGGALKILIFSPQTQSINVIKFQYTRRCSWSCSPPAATHPFHCPRESPPYPPDPPTSLQLDHILLVSRQARHVVVVGGAAEHSHHPAVLLQDAHLLAGGGGRADCEETGQHVQTYREQHPNQIVIHQHQAFYLVFYSSIQILSYEIYFMPRKRIITKYYVSL